MTEPLESNGPGLLTAHNMSVIVAGWVRMLCMAFRGVLFDFHKTLVVAGSLETWLLQSADASGEGDVTANDILPVLRTVWTRAAHRYPNSQWDLDARLHRGAFEDVLTSESQCSATLAAALYDTMPKQWLPVPGAVELLRVLKSRGHQVGLLSNTALDVRPRLAELGLLAYLDTVVLSFEEGLVKPDPRIFRLAADRLGIPADQCVFVGDTPQVDGDAVHAGMTSLLVPITGDIPQLQTAATLLIGTQ